MKKSIYGLGSLLHEKGIKTPPLGIFSARVRYVFLNDKTHPEIFNDYGGWDSLGAIFFSSLNSPNPSKDLTSNSFAKPLFPNIKNYPLINETVYVISLPNNNIQRDVNDGSYYYFHPINIWNSSHHNAIPDPIHGVYNSPSSDYEQTALGSFNKIVGNSSNIFLGESFKEKDDIRNSYPYEGDIIYEGRWGQSIRFGSTVKGKNIINYWSSEGENGDPITIIKNKQYKESSSPWVPQIEDINKNGSSIWFTSTQKIPIEVVSNDYSSYKNPPIKPSEFNKEQVIINSDRILINAKKDSILFSSYESINLNSIKSVNIDSPLHIVNSKKVLLGSKDATESMILGDKFFKDLKEVLKGIVSISNALSTPIGAGPPNVVNASIPAPAIKLGVKAQNMINKLETYKSKVSKSK